jgi:inorganic pyrophosphatase
MKKTLKSPANKGFPFRPHPWHGIEPGLNPPKIVTAYIEITPFDGIKYEIDKGTGYLKVDRPQTGASLPPALYGFIPQTYCAENVAKLSKSAKKGDGDPLDILVLSERPITKSEVLISARVIGGLRMIDRGEADDKILAVLSNDPYYSKIKEMSQLELVIQNRLKHYFFNIQSCPWCKPNGSNRFTI